MKEVNTENFLILRKELDIQVCEAKKTANYYLNAKRPSARNTTLKKTVKIIHMSSLEKCQFSSLAHFLIGSFIFLELSCLSYLYIFEISCLSVASFAIIFSHSEGCLLTLLIFSFVVQKLLILIRSHLFIFAFISRILGGGS